ncbi:MAG TPA: HSP20 family small heat-shock protein [Jatrophihabitantaceae bacterium]|jgi:HSP20 family protein
MLMHTDPFRDLDRLAAALAGTTGTASRPTALAMDAWREGDEVLFEFDLPGVDPKTIDLDVERNVLTIRAEREPVGDSRDMLAAERPRGVFSRQLVLGDNLDLERIDASYDAGVLALRVPVAERAKPRRIAVQSQAGIESG